MAVLLVWASWAERAPDEATWQELAARAAARTPLAGSEIAGDGYRVLVARGRPGEADCLDIKPDSVTAWDGSEPMDRRCADLRQILAEGRSFSAVRIHRNRQRIELARDTMGRQLLVWASIPGGLVAASGEHILRAHPAVSATLDEDYLAAFLAHVPSAQNASAYRDIRVLAAGELLTVEAGRFRSERFRPGFNDAAWGLRDAQIIERHRDLVESAVRRACSDVDRIGISLSAGLDSSTVAAFVPANLRTQIRPVCYGFDRWPEIDERRLVGDLCRQIGLVPESFAADDLTPFNPEHRRTVDPDTPLAGPYREIKERLYDCFEAGGVDVWLTGNFGDHLQADHDSWLISGMRQGRWRALGRELLNLATKRPWIAYRDRGLRRGVRALLNRQRPPPGAVNALRDPWRSRVRDRLIAEVEGFRDFPRPEQAHGALGAYANRDACAENYYAQRRGMQQRAPFRDYELSRWCLSLPTDVLYRRGISKWILRQTLQGRVPASVAARPKASLLTHYALSGLRQAQPRLLAACAEVSHLIDGFIDPPVDGNEEAQAVHQLTAATFALWLETAEPDSRKA